MTAKAVLTLIQMVGLTPMKVGPQTMEQMLSQLNLVNGSIQIMMDSETTSMVSSQTIVRTVEVTQTSTDSAV